MDIILNRYNFSPSFSSIETFEPLRAQAQTLCIIDLEITIKNSIIPFLLQTLPKH